MESGPEEGVPKQQPQKPLLPWGCLGIDIGCMAVVLGVAGLVIAFAFPVWKSVRDGHRHGMQQAEIQLMSIAIKMYEMDHGEYPEPVNVALVRSLQLKRKDGSPYFEFPPDGLSPGGEVLDTWGKPLVYQRVLPENDRSPIRFTLYSCGPNGVDDGGKGDDISFEH